MPAGRPTKYRPEYCDQLVEFFSREPYRKELKASSTAYGKGGNVTLQRNEYMFFPNDPPFLFQFAAKIGVHESVLVDWVDKFPEFAAAYARAKDLFKVFLITNGLNRTADASFSIFTAKNTTDMKDKTEIDVNVPFIEAVREAARIRDERNKALLLESGK